MTEELKQALRQIRAHPGYTLVVVMTLALGIGANTAIFSLTRGVLLRPLPYRNGDALVHIVPRVAGAVGDDLSFPVLEMLDYRQQNRMLAAVVEYHSMSFNLIGHGEPDRVETGVVSASFFREFGVKPFLGRDFRPQDDEIGAEPVLLLTYEYWQERFGGDAGVIGTWLRMNDRPIQVIGVLPRLPPYPGRDKVFMPTAGCPFRSSEQVKGDRSTRMVSLWARLKPGASPQQTQADLTTIAARLQSEYPAAAVTGMTVSPVPVKEELVGAFQPTVLILLGTVGLVLLVACANVANLTFARLASRDRELMVRAALGASRGQLTRQLLAESLLPSLLGGVVGCALAAVALDLLVAFAHRFTARADEIRIDGPVLVFALVVSLIAGLVSGWSPIVRILRKDLAPALREGVGRGTPSAGKHRFRDSMVAAQVGVSFIVLIGAGLMARSLALLRQVDPGFKTKEVLTATIELPFSKYSTNPQMASFYSQLLADLANHPGVVSAAVSSDAVMSGTGLRTPSFRIKNQPDIPGQPAPRANLSVASPNYFHTLGIPLLAGRTFTEMDNSTAQRVVIINQSLARQWWPERSPIGQRIAVGRNPDWQVIIGVVGDVRQHGLAMPAPPALYMPFLQFPGGGTQVFVRTRQAPELLGPQLRTAVWNLDREQPVVGVQTLEDVYSASVAPARVFTSVLILFAGLTLAITGIGIAAAVIFSATERIPEMAVRLAVGAKVGSVRWLIFRRAMGPVVGGLAGGVAASLGLTRFLGGLLFGVAPTDPASMVGALLVMLFVAAVACSLPARRVTTVDPVSILRS